MSSVMIAVDNGRGERVDLRPSEVSHMHWERGAGYAKLIITMRSGDRIVLHDYGGSAYNAESAIVAAEDNATALQKERDALRAQVERLRTALSGVLAHDWAEECQECGIGQSAAWQAARAALGGSNG